MRPFYAAVIACVAFTSGCASGRPASRAAPPQRFYERVRAQRKLHPDAAVLNRATSAEMESLGWLVGRWTGTVKVFATPTLPERSGIAGEEYFEFVPDSNMLWTRNAKEGSSTFTPEIGFDPVSRVWILYLIGPSAWGMSTSLGWDGNRLAFIGDVTIFGVTARLRHTLVKVSENEMEIVNDEQLGTDTTWVPVDAYHFTKVR
jgi:hypothetical protein